MSKKSTYEYTGSTRVDHYKRKPKPPKDPWDTIGPIILGIIILSLLSSCFG